MKSATVFSDEQDSSYVDGRLVLMSAESGVVMWFHV